MKIRKILTFSEFLPLIPDYYAFGADGPAVAFGHEEAVEVVGGGAFLFDPGAAFVG